MAKATHHRTHEDLPVLRSVAVKKNELNEWTEQEEAMSPKGAIFRHPYMDSYILVILGLSKRIDVASMKSALQTTLVKHKRFSSIVKSAGRGGNCKWVRTEVDIEKHMIVPNLSPAETERKSFVEDYTASLAIAPPLDPSRPLWQIHVLNCISAEAQASVVFKIHHCIGDCVSLMSLLLDCTRKVTEPESSPTIPRMKRPGKNRFSRWSAQGIWNLMFVVWCTIADLLHALATFLWMKDSKVLRGPPGVIHHPKRLAHVIVDLKDIGIVRKAVKGTVNDVVTAMLSAGFVRYLNRRHEPDIKGKVSNLRLQALVPVNIRASPGLHKLEYMMNNPKEAGWGNGFGLWILPISLDKQDDCLEYCRVAATRANKKKASFEAPLTFFLTALLSRIFGINCGIYLPYRASVNTTLVFSNVLGPVEEVQFQGNPVKHIVTTVSGLPQPLVVHFQSYAGKAKFVAMAAQDVFSDPHELCMDCADALKQMKEAALASVNTEDTYK
eukprot:Gb_17371 [translate_table: standard]